MSGGRSGGRCCIDDPRMRSCVLNARMLLLWVMLRVLCMTLVYGTIRLVNCSSSGGSSSGGGGSGWGRRIWHRGCGCAGLCSWCKGLVLRGGLGLSHRMRLTIRMCLGLGYIRGGRCRELGVASWHSVVSLWRGESSLHSVCLHRCACRCGCLEVDSVLCGQHVLRLGLPGCCLGHLGRAHRRTGRGKHRKSVPVSQAEYEVVVEMEGSYVRS